MTSEPQHSAHGAQASSGAAAHSSAKPRIALWDNARFALIVLVVVGHAISTIRTDSTAAFGLYAFIYLFHMPAFIMLAGVFSKAEVTPRAARSTVQLLVTWGLWEGIWALIRFFVNDKVPGGSFLVSPAWTLWFLVSLATMRILLPYMLRLKHPLIASIVLALAGGLTPAIGTEFSASRTLCFLPFFVAGFLARDRGWLAGNWFLRPTKALRGLAGAVLAATALVLILLPGVKSTWRIDKWLTWRDDYAWLFKHAPIGGSAPTDWWLTMLAGAGVRAGLIAVAFALTMAVLLVVPRAHSIATTWGARTLYVYLLHGVIIWTLRETGVIDTIGAWGLMGLVTVILLGVVIAVVLSTGWIAKLTRPIIEPKIDWLARK